MIFRFSDPVDDFEAYDAQVSKENEKCPVCDSCGEPITEETFSEVVYMGKILRFHDDCVSSQFTSDYIERGEGFQV